MSSRRGPKGTAPGGRAALPPGVEQAAPDDPTFIASKQGSEDEGWGLAEADQPARRAGYEIQPRTSIYQGRRANRPAADPEVLQLLSTDLGGLDPDDVTDENDAVAAMESSTPLPAPLQPTHRAAPSEPTIGPRSSVRSGDLDAAVPALHLSRRPIPRDFDEDLRTRVRAATDRDPSLSDALELSLSDAIAGVPVDAYAKTALPQLPPEKSVVRRIVHSVIARMPRAMQGAAERSGLVNLPAQASGPLFSMGMRDARALGIDPRAWREARTAPIFDGLPNEALREALHRGQLSILRIDRDTIIPVGGGLVLVRSGQVALAQFPPDKLQLEREAAEKLLGHNPLIGKKLDKKERRRRQKAGPLIRMAEKNLATFEEGDVVEISAGARQHETLGIYSVTPVTVLTIERAVAEYWRQSFPFMADRLRRAGASARARVEATAGAKAIVADFFIRHGLSVSLTLRVRKLDACIECGACEKACEERYGGKRLSLNGRVLGNLDFVDACHTCTDQRCVDPCNFDAIAFDPQRKEVLINEANCTGCTLCAVACPYDAIEMYELDDKPKLKLRLEKAGHLAYGEGAGRKAKLRRIASKCDHCAFYEDQACVSACPTGALIEIHPSDVVAQMPEQARATARAGFDRTAHVDIGQLNQLDHFARRGLSQLPELGRARARRDRLSMRFWWAFWLVAYAAVCVEIALRKLAPHRSVAYLVLTRADGFDHDMALDRVDFRPGSELAVNLGYVGTALMITGLFYVWRRRLPFMRNAGSLRAWFDWHVLSGVMGPAFILLHSAAKLDNWVSLAFWAMIVTFLSGLLGRYLTTQLPQAANIATVETLEIDRRLGKLRIEHPGVRVADGWFEDYRRRLAAFQARFDGPPGRGGHRVPREPTVGDGVHAVLWLIKDDVLRRARAARLWRTLSASVRGPEARKVKKRAYKLALRLERLERRRVLLPRLEPLFLRWKAIHVPMAVMLTIIATLHIFLSLKNG